MPKSHVRRHYRINNWSEYNRALVNRGSLTVWVEEKAVAGWLAQREPKRRGRPKQYSDEAILMLITLRFVFHLPLRALQGFAVSIFQLMGLDLPVPHYTQICRRAAKLKKRLARIKKRGGICIVFDSTGLKVYGEGEWKVRTHGAGKRRTWKKLHLGIDPDSQQIVVSELTGRDGGDAATAASMLDQLDCQLNKVLGDGAYDGAVLRETIERLGGNLITPPPRNAKYKGFNGGWERKRDEALAEIQGLGGDEVARALWKRLKGYHQRSLVETAMYRYKQILGDRLRSRGEDNQHTESICKCLILNKMANLGLPKGEWVEIVA